MEDETSNLEWKKKSFGETEKVTRKTNVKKALQFEATNKSPINNNLSPLPADLPKGLKNLRKKIIKKDAYDDDEDEEGGFVLMPMEQNNSSLLNALHEDEKRQLKQQETITTMQMQQTAGKVDALMMANKVTKDLGLRGLKSTTINSNMQDVTLNANNYGKAVKDDVTKKLRLNGKHLSERETITMLRGIKEIQGMAAEAGESKTKALEGLEVGDIMEFGKAVKTGSKNKTEKEELAKKILRKSGRSEEETQKAINKNKSRPKNNEIINNKNLYRE